MLAPSTEYRLSLMIKCQDVFTTSDYQHGFKKSHSTSHCTFVVNEVIQYYHNNDTNVYSPVADWHILQKVVLASIRCFIGVYGI